jgi:hypothetical protein
MLTNNIKKSLSILCNLERVLKRDTRENMTVKKEAKHLVFIDFI